MNNKVLLALCLILTLGNYAGAVENSKETISSIELEKQLKSEDNLFVSIVKKIKNGDQLDRDEVVFINTLWISTLTFGILNGYLATSRLQLPLTESLYAAGIGAGLGFIVGLPAATFNYYEWYD